MASIQECENRNKRIFQEFGITPFKVSKTPNPPIYMSEIPQKNEKIQKEVKQPWFDFWWYAFVHGILPRDFEFIILDVFSYPNSRNETFIKVLVLRLSKRSNVRRKETEIMEPLALICVVSTIMYLLFGDGY